MTPRWRMSAADILRDLATLGRDETLRRRPELGDDDLRECLLFAAELIEANSPSLPMDTATMPPAEEYATLPPPADPDATLAPPMPIPSGTARVSVPGYEILSELGRGGMGVVNKARHVRLSRVVALKMILAGEHAGDEMRARFQTEAEAVARLQHPGIVQVFEVGEHDGHSFLALEFVEGGSLAARLSAEPWDAKDAAALVEKLARAVQAAHDKGIVHRDLKPENVLLSNDAPKVTDFGLAKKLEADGRTQTGAVMGTPSYMAPEQAAGRKDVGPPADTYALGGMLYRLMTGRPAFEGPTTLDVLMRVLEDEPKPLRQLNRKIPRDLETITLKCLSKEPSKRYASASDLADDLRRFLDGEPIRARASSSIARGVRWSLKHSDQAALRVLMALAAAVAAGVATVSAGWSGLNNCLVAAALIAFAFRGRPRPIVVVCLAGLPLAAALAAGFYAYHDSLIRGQWLPARTNAFEVTWLLALAPLPLALLVSAGFREGRQAYLGLLFALILGVALGSPASYRTLVYGSLPVCYFALVSRLVRWKFGGSLFDIAGGALLGGLISAMIGAALAGCFLGSLMQVGSAMTLYSTLIPLLTLCFGVTGSILGAVRIAYSTRRRYPLT